MVVSEEILKEIQKAAYKIRKFYTFDIYDAEDIEQEAVLIGLAIIHKWDGKRDIGKFLQFSMKNRLINLIKSKRSYSSDLSKQKILLENASNTEVEDVLEDPYEFDPVDTEELLLQVDRVVPYDMRMDFLKMKENIYVVKARRDEIINEIRARLNTKQVGSFLQLLYTRWDNGL